MFGVVVDFTAVLRYDRHSTFVRVYVFLVVSALAVHGWNFTYQQGSGNRVQQVLSLRAMILVQPKEGSPRGAHGGEVC